MNATATRQFLYGRTAHGNLRHAYSESARPLRSDGNQPADGEKGLYRRSLCGRIVTPQMTDQGDPIPYPGNGCKRCDENVRQTEKDAANSHLYELIPVDENGREVMGGAFIGVGVFDSVEWGERGAVREACDIMGDDVSIDCVKVYHSYPSPGPQRRYVGIVIRGFWNLVRAS